MTKLAGEFLLSFYVNMQNVTYHIDFSQFSCQSSVKFFTNMYCCVYEFVNDINTQFSDSVRKLKTSSIAILVA